eukprot:Filipodium_phascolosomae@DN2768_c0_g1_i8.p1
MHSEFSQLQDGEAEILKLPPQRQVDCLDLGGADADFLRKVLPQVFHVFPNLQEIIVVDDPNILTWANWNELLSKNLLCDPSWTSTLRKVTGVWSQFIRHTMGRSFRCQIDIFRDTSSDFFSSRRLLPEFLSTPEEFADWHIFHPQE